MIELGHQNFIAEHQHDVDIQFFKCVFPVIMQYVPAVEYYLFFRRPDFEISTKLLQCGPFYCGDDIDVSAEAK